MGKRIDIEEWAIPRRVVELLGVPDTQLRMAMKRGDVRVVVLYGDTVLCNLLDVDRLVRTSRPARPRVHVKMSDE